MIGSPPLLRTLRKLLPDAQFMIVHERAWHSMTFAGLQIRVCAVSSGDDHAAVAAEFAGTLSEQEFDLRGQLVADIAVAETSGGKNETRMLIDALIIGD